MHVCVVLQNYMKSGWEICRLERQIQYVCEVWLPLKSKKKFINVIVLLQQVRNYLYKYKEFVQE